MHQNAFGGRATPGPAGGAHSAPPYPLAVFGKRGEAPGKGSGMGRGKERGREGKRGQGREMGKKGRGGEGKEGKGVCPSNFYRCPHFIISGVAPGRDDDDADDNNNTNNVIST